MPESVIRRRFWKSLINFGRVYKPLATTWRVVDGSSLSDRVLIATGTAGQKPAVIDETRWAEIRKRMEEQA